VTSVHNKLCKATAAWAVFRESYWWAVVGQIKLDEGNISATQKLK